MSWKRSRSNRKPDLPHLPSKATLSALVMVVGLCASIAAADEPCNPIIDGTYCATNMSRTRNSTKSSSGMKPLEDYSRLVPSASVGGAPGTLFGLSMQGSSTCLGLLRRSICD